MRCDEAGCGSSRSSASLSHDVMNNAGRMLHFSFANSKMPSANSRKKKKKSAERQNAKPWSTSTEHRAYVHFVQFMLHWKLLFIFMYFLRFSQWQFSLVIFCGRSPGRQLLLGKSHSYDATSADGKDMAFHFHYALVLVWRRRRGEMKRMRKNRSLHIYLHETITVSYNSLHFFR